MKRLLIPVVLSAALLASACVTVIDASEGTNWQGENAQPFDAARQGCKDTASDNVNSSAFIACMAAKGWTRD